jgi:signal transduction histidine kinase
MSPSTTFPDPATLDRQAELAQVLSAWHGATLRLEQTHEALRTEVCRLSDELEVKNRELARKNRLADLGQMAAHVAHEVRNNLVPVTLYLSLLERKLSEDEVSANILDKVKHGFAALESTVQDLLSFTSDRDPNLEQVALQGLVAEIVASLEPQLVAQAIEVELDVPAASRVMGDRGMLRSAILNLALNAVDAMPQGGRLRVASFIDANGWELEVADSGLGLCEQASKRAFEPFFTTKRNGTGLGLSIVYRIAEVHGGEVVARNRSTGGAVFTLRFPHQAQGTAA